jgi:peptidoglycan hydrolase-like protein with peptidoglycan-binding domain
MTIARLFYKATSVAPLDPGSGTTTSPTPSPSPAPTPAPADSTLTAPTLTENLRRGSKGEAVRQIQLRLAELGYPVGAADGSFGPMTEQAVKLFQRKAGLVVDGVVGSHTVSALYQATAPRY